MRWIQVLAASAVLLPAAAHGQATVTATATVVESVAGSWEVPPLRVRAGRVEVVPADRGTGTRLLERVWVEDETDGEERVEFRESVRAWPAPGRGARVRRVLVTREIAVNA